MKFFISFSAVLILIACSSHAETTAPFPLRISPDVDFNGITANAIVSYQPDGKDWTIQINLFSKAQEDIEKERPPTLKVFNPTGMPLKVKRYADGYSMIGGISSHLFVVYTVEAQSLKDIAEAEVEFKEMKRRIQFRPKTEQPPQDSGDRSSRDSSGVFDESQVESFWNGLWNVAPKPTPDPLAGKEVERLHGTWECKIGVTPDLISVSIAPNHTIEMTGEKDGRAWIRAGKWKIVNDKCVILLEGKPPNFIIRIKDDFFIFDPWATHMLSRLLR